jgi:nitronate monooxygenase
MPGDLRRLGSCCRGRYTQTFMASISPLPALTIKGMLFPVPVVQGGMGVGVSLHPLAIAVSRGGGLGVLSSAGLDRVVSRRLGRTLAIDAAVREEVEAAKAEGGYAGINIMVALQRDYEASVRGAIDGGVDAIVSGAGLPLTLPDLRPPEGVALIPIVSSARALDLICRRWERQGYRPDAVVLEGPLAGGHLGMKKGQIDLEENRLERLLPPVKSVAQAHGDFPVIVAGGVYDHADVRRFLSLGADGVQLGTRFLATEESSASEAHKQAVVRAGPQDILVAYDPGSPCGLPFRVLRESPMYQSALARRRTPKCDKGYVLLKDGAGRFTRCPAKEDNARDFCICNGLLSSAGCEDGREEPLYTAGTTACRVDRILPVSELMAELVGAA